MNHITYSVKELYGVFGGQIYIDHEEVRVGTLLIDSRKMICVNDALFFALKGRRDGHLFIAELYHAGVRSFVVDDPSFDRAAYVGSNFYLVDDTLVALQNLAAYHRLHFKCPVIAITGSNGKTVVKEWLYQLLMPDYTIVRNPKSYNSQVGVPLSVWEIGEKDNLAIFEAGISKVGEMEHLAKIIYPTIGVLTNIGSEHDDNFRSTDEKIAEKLKLFEGVDLFIYSKKYLQNYKGTIPGKKQFSWSLTPTSLTTALSEGEGDKVIQVSFARKEGAGGQVSLSFGEGRGEALIPFTDHSSIENAIICWATLFAMGYQPDEASARLQKLIPVNIRLELKSGINNCSLIDDSASLDTYSLAIALDFLKQQQQHARRTVILSDIPELGANRDEVYQHVASLLKNKSVDCLIGVGEQIKYYANLFSIETHFWCSSASGQSGDISRTKEQDCLGLREVR